MATSTILEKAHILCKNVENEWKLVAMENSREVHYTLSVHSVGKKYIKVTSKLSTDPADRTGGVYMFINKLTGNCYGVKSWNQADKLCRGTVDNFIDYPEMCSPYGGFAYLPKRG